ncbi:hypothetical protein [Robbsia sp. KACC 23696]
MGAQLDAVAGALLGQAGGENRVVQLVAAAVHRTVKSDLPQADEQSQI